MIPYTTKVGQRSVGFSISGETHIIGITGVATVTSGLISLIEVPQGPAPAVTIPGYTEITVGSPVGTQFLVNYVTGTITFNVSQDGNSVSVSYIGLGSEIACTDINELQEPVGIALNIDGSLSNGVVFPASISIESIYPLTFPAAQGTIGQTIINDGSGNLSWALIGHPAGLTGAIQFNNGGAFGGDASNLYWDNTNKALGVGGAPLGIYSVQILTGTGASLSTNGSISAGTSILVGSHVSTPQLLGSNYLTIAPSVDSTTAIRITASSTIGAILDVDTLNNRVGINTTTPAAALDVTSTTSGFLPPRMTTTQKNAISSPATGLVVYDSTLGYLQEYNGSSWTGVAAPGGTSGQIEYNNGGVFGGLTIGSLTTPIYNNSGTLALSISLPLQVVNGTLSIKYFNLSPGTISDTSGFTSIDYFNRILYGPNGSSAALAWTNSNVGIGTVSPAATAVLDLTSTTTGFLPPRMTTTQRNAISSPVDGLMVYVTDVTPGIYAYISGSWTQL